MATQTAVNTTPSEAPSPFATERHIFVLFSIALVAVMFVGMVGLLYWRERPAASALLVLRVPPANDGAIATIDLKYGQGVSPIVKTLEGGQEVRIPLPPGEYVVRIEHKNKRIRAEPILSENSYYPIIIEDPATTQPKNKSTKK